MFFLHAVLGSELGCVSADIGMKRMKVLEALPSNIPMELMEAIIHGRYLVAIVSELMPNSSERTLDLVRP